MDDYYRKNKIYIYEGYSTQSSQQKQKLIQYSKDSKNILEIGFNARYLLDIASQIDGSNILFALEGSGSPALIADSDDSQATYVLMPMRV